MTWTSALVSGALKNVGALLLIKNEIETVERSLKIESEDFFIPVMGKRKGTRYVFKRRSARGSCNQDTIG